YQDNVPLELFSFKISHMLCSSSHFISFKNFGTEPLDVLVQAVADDLKKNKEQKDKMQKDFSK
ncbi:hypothetical protein, partial [Bacillus cereus]|uniref:hypothetical protein n=1 Tax=Bacillus cereus TaxID=1396 RepID=UPI001A7E6816